MSPAVIYILPAFYCLYAILTDSLDILLLSELAINHLATSSLTGSTLSIISLGVIVECKAALSCSYFVHLIVFAESPEAKQVDETVAKFARAMEHLKELAEGMQYATWFKNTNTFGSPVETEELSQDTRKGTSTM